MGRCNPDVFIYTGSKWASFVGNSKQDKKAMERYRKRLAAGKEKTAAEQMEKAKKKKVKAREAANKTNVVVQERSWARMPRRLRSKTEHAPLPR